MYTVIFSPFLLPFHRYVKIYYDYPRYQTNVIRSNSPSWITYYRLENVSTKHFYLILYPQQKVKAWTFEKKPKDETI